MPRNPGVTDEMIIKLYKSGMSYKEMKPILGISDRAIRNVIHKHGIPTNQLPGTGRPRKNKVNEHYFKTWSHEMAWVLGMFVTDGHVSSLQHSIYFAQKDERILRLIASYMEADYITGPLGKTKTTPTLHINSKIIKEDLAALGITPKKSLIVPFPEVPEEYLSSFVRGVIDGDGWVENRGYQVIVTSGSEYFANGLLSVYQNWRLNSGILVQTSNSNNKIYRIWVKGKADVAKLSAIIYECSDKENFHIYKRVFMTQHAKTPYLAEDDRSDPAWKIENGKVKHINNSNKMEFKARINKARLKFLRKLAADSNQHINLLIENGLRNMMNNGKNTVQKRTKSSERIEFRSTYDKDLLEKAKHYAQDQGIAMSDLIEHSIDYIDGREAT